MIMRKSPHTVRTVTEMIFDMELLELLELIHDSVNCLCAGWMYECDLKKKIQEIQSAKWQKEREESECA